MSFDWRTLPPDTRPDGARYDFYRCQKCFRVITALEERAVLAEVPDEPATGRICRCGSRKYSPTDVVGEPPNDLEPGAGADLDEESARALFNEGMLQATEEWLDPRVEEFAWLRYRGLA